MIGAAASKPYTAFDPNDGVANVHIATHGIRRCYSFQCTDGIHRIVENFAIYTFQFTLNKIDGNFFFFGFGKL